MAILYVRSTDGNNSDNGSTWALAKATLAGALSAASAGDTIYVSHVHSESAGALISLASPGTNALPVYVLCANDGAEPPTTLATSGILQCGSGNFPINFTGSAYYYGIEFVSGTTNNNINVTDSGGFAITFEQCILHIGNANSGARIALGPNNTGSSFARTTLINTRLRFGSTGQRAIARSFVDWQGGSVHTSGSVPAALFLGGSGIPCNLRVHGVDLSYVSSGNALMDVSGGGNDVQFEACKLASGVVLTTGTFTGPGGTFVRLVNCDSADTNYRYARGSYAGTITHSTGVTLQDGTTDGTTPISMQMASSASTTLVTPLYSDAIPIWNEAIGSSLTATVEIITNNVTLTDAEAWLEVEYLGTSGFPQALHASDRKANILSSAANQASSSATWTSTTGIGTPLKQKLEVAFTPQEKGPVVLRVALAKPSTTMWFDFNPATVLS